MRAVVNSVSAAVPAPAHQILGEMKCSFSQFLSATMGPEVARVSAAIWEMELVGVCMRCDAIEGERLDLVRERI